jgi:hypothetical protein
VDLLVFLVAPNNLALQVRVDVDVETLHDLEEHALLDITLLVCIND